ncbi:MAG TPA: hypothetical protein VEX88_02900 [Glaciibacter sp.]|nr:hypothetical protein [Glaciibacter sp.]
MQRGLIGLSIVIATMLSGCAQPNVAGVPPPTGSSSPSADPAPSPESSHATNADAGPGLLHASAILVRALGLDVVDSAGDILLSASYYDSLDQVVDGLTRATGAAPVVGEFADDLVQGAGTSYQWDGLKVLDHDRPAEMPVTPEWSVVVTGSTAGQLSVSTADLLTIGLSQAEVEELAPGDLAVSSEEGGIPYAAGASEVTRMGASTGSGDMVSQRVLFILKGSPLVLVEMSAPDPVGGH